MSSEMRPESLVPPLSAGTARGKRGIGGGSLAELSGESSRLEDATGLLPSSVMKTFATGWRGLWVPPFWETTSGLTQEMS